jgi:DNA-binding transcriptional LysR family regulator
LLNLVHLKVLAAVARHGSVTEAAKELHYSQPSVSHHLSRLEAATGVKLVQRVGRGIRPTPQGHLLANRATEIVGRVDAATDVLHAYGYFGATPCGIHRDGMSPSLYPWVPEWANACQACRDAAPSSMSAGR